MADRKLIRAVAIVAYAVIAIFLWLYIQRLDLEVVRESKILWRYLLLALPASLMSRLLFVFGWRQILAHYGRRQPDFPTLNNIYATTWLARYVPGKVLYYLGKIHLAVRHGVTKEDAALSSLLEVALQLGVGLLVGLALVLASGEVASLGLAAVVITIGLLAATAIGLSPAVFNRGLRLLSRRLRQATIDESHFVDRRLLARLVAIYGGVHVLSGVPVFLVLKSIEPGVALSVFPFVTGVVILSGVLGSVALFAPSGIGVRETVQLAMLPAVVSGEVALVFAVVLRIWAILVDLLYWAISAAIVLAVRPRIRL